MHKCARSGYLVDGAQALPSDPTDLYVERLPIVGCSRIRCSHCGALVRNAVGLSFRTPRELTADQFKALYAADELSTSELLHADQPEWRLYLCKCSRWLETSQHPCVDPDPDENAPQMPWSCDGHPPIQLPYDIDGVSVATREEIRALATRGFHGVAPPRTRASDQVRGEWLARLHERLGPTEAPVVAAVATTSLEDPAPRTRGLALWYFYGLPSDQARARMLELLVSRRELFAKIPDEVTPITADKTLEDSLWRVIGPLLATAGPAREIARPAALGGTASIAMYYGLARYDSDWIMTHGDEIARAAPQRVEELVASFSQLPRTMPIKALRERIRAAVAKP